MKSSVFAHSPRSFGSRVQRRHIGLAALGIAHRAIGADQRREKILGFAGARVAPADPDLLRLRCGIDIHADQRASLATGLAFCA